MTVDLGNTTISSNRRNLGAGRLATVDSPDVVVEIHQARYKFASGYAAGAKVLDIASGIGYGSHVLLKKGKASLVIGADISVEAIEEANQRYKSENLSFELITHGRLPFPDKSFDVVVSFETIEHTPNQKEFLQELRRVLKDLGKLIISTPNKRFHSYGKRKPWNPYHTVEYFPLEFKALLLNQFRVMEFWGGQEFCSSGILTLLKHNWTEIKYYKILHHPLLSRLIAPAVSLKRSLVQNLRGHKGEHEIDPSLYERRCQVVEWKEKLEPYTLVAVCQK